MRLYRKMRPLAATGIRVSTVQHVTNHQHCRHFYQHTSFEIFLQNIDSVKKWQFVNFPLLTDWIAIFWMRCHGSACQRQSVTPRYWFSSAFDVSIGDGCIWEEVCGMWKIPHFNLVLVFNISNFKPKSSIQYLRPLNWTCTSDRVDPERSH